MASSVDMSRQQQKRVYESMLQKLRKQLEQQENTVTRLEATLQTATDTFEATREEISKKQDTMRTDLIKGLYEQAMRQSKNIKQQNAVTQSREVLMGTVLDPPTLETLLGKALGLDMDVMALRNLEKEEADLHKALMRNITDTVENIRIRNEHLVAMQDTVDKERMELNYVVHDEPYLVATIALAPLYFELYEFESVKTWIQDSLNRQYTVPNRTEWKDDLLPLVLAKNNPHMFNPLVENAELELATAWDEDEQREDDRLGLGLV